MTLILCTKCVINYGMGSEDSPHEALTIHKGDGLCAAHLADTLASSGVRDRILTRFVKRFSGSAKEPVES